eukprot:CAMPEP_0171021320 /NCGR_PEP_ID=MMETSP0736-20130129/30561_1 /TAXON_ID=186038 /ORGANISM="Fragilariopsis kerguelensis, Strain L26-C5" /LENGTH=248 /DNA_ID=CAMNT_0011459531 /DNA_START=101 /DNA_END=844 /DNA_ORIENTATION=-
MGTTTIEELKKKIETVEKSLKERVTTLDTLLTDLKNEKALEPPLSVITIRIFRINNLMKILGKLDDSINDELVKYISKKERKDEQDKIDRYKEDVSQLKDGDESQLVVCEDKIAKLEARIKTLSARQNIFKVSVYLFLHKAREEKYTNIVDNTENTVTWIHIIIANLTILFQIGVYIFIISLLMLKKGPDDILDQINPNATIKLELEIPEPQFDYLCLRYFTFLGAIGVLLGNLFPDIIGVFVLRIRW